MGECPARICLGFRSLGADRQRLAMGARLLETIIAMSSGLLLVGSNRGDAPHSASLRQAAARDQVFSFSRAQATTVDAFNLTG